MFSNIKQLKQLEDLIRGLPDLKGSIKRFEVVLENEGKSLVQGCEYWLQNVFDGIDGVMCVGAKFEPKKMVTSQKHGKYFLEIEAPETFINYHNQEFLFQGQDKATIKVQAQGR